MNKKALSIWWILTATPFVGGICALSGALAQAGKTADGNASYTFTLDPKGATEAKVGYFPVQVKLTSEKPVGIKKEPAYRTTPKYASIHIGNGPKSTVLIAVDEPQDADYKVYVDANQNGDLTDDGDGAWSNKTERGGRINYGVNHYTIRASWGGANREAASAPYGIAFYRFTGQDYLLYYREGARTGTVTVEGKQHKALLIENDGDALYSKPVTDPEKAKGARPIWLLVDLKDEGKFSSGPIDIRAPFKLADAAYEADISADGSTLKLAPTTKPVVDLRPKPKALLATGTLAPDFSVEKWGGGTLRLADLKGKVVVLDFWATWCGPCQRSMPHVEKVWKSVQGQDVAVLGVCVWDEKAAYERWIPENSNKYTFQFAYDAAGRDTAKSVAGGLYSVSGIPTTYIIDKEGKVAASIVGYQDGDTRVEEALKKLGVQVSASEK